MTKKKKVLIILGSILGALIVLGIILFFTAFSLKNADIKFETTNEIYDTQTLSNDIKENCEIDFGKSVFLMDKKKTILSIEKNYPNLKVINIETKFPSSVLIHLALRQQLFAFERDGQTYICDEELKVLEIKQDYLSTKSNAILVEGKTPTNEGEIKEADFLEFEGFDTANFKKIYLALFRNNRNKLESMAYFKTTSFEKRINPESFADETTLILKSHSDFVYQIFDYENRLESKFNKLFACDYTIEGFNRAEYELLIYDNSKGEIFAKLKNLT